MTSCQSACFGSGNSNEESSAQGNPIWNNAFVGALSLGLIFGVIFAACIFFFVASQTRSDKGAYSVVKWLSGTAISAALLLVLALLVQGGSNQGGGLFSGGQKSIDWWLLVTFVSFALPHALLIHTSRKWASLDTEEKSGRQLQADTNVPSKVKTEQLNLESLGDRVSRMTIEDIALELNRSERSVQASLFRRGIKCLDYDGAAALAEIPPNESTDERELRLNKNYIAKLRASEELLKPGNRGIIISVKANKGEGEAIISYIGCHGSSGELLNEFQIFNSFDDNGEGEAIVSDLSAGNDSPRKRTGFVLDMNVTSLISLIPTPHGPGDSTKIFQKKFPKEVAYFSVLASTATEYLTPGQQYRAMQLEIFWDGLSGKRDEFHYDTSSGSAEHIVLFGLLVRQKNNRWKFHRTPGRALEFQHEQAFVDSNSLRPHVESMVRASVAALTGSESDGSPILRETDED